MNLTETPRLVRGAPEAPLLAGHPAPGIPSDTLAVILAGTHAWGGNALDRLIARPLLPIGDRPLIAHTLGWLRRAGIRQASICANSGTMGIRRALPDGRGWGVELDYYEDVLPRGPAGCALDAFLGRGASLCVVVEGTILPEFDLSEMVAHHFRSNADLTVLAGQPEPGRGAHEDALRPLGVYVASPRVLDAIPAHGYQDIKEALIPRLRGGGARIIVHPVHGHEVCRIATAGSYLAANKRALRRLAAGGVPPQGYSALGDGFAHDSARVHPGATVLGPVLIGPESTVCEGAILSGPTLVGAQCSIAAGATLSRSVVWDRAVLGEGCRVDHSLIAQAARVEAGASIRGAIHAPPRPRPQRLWKRISALWPTTSAGGTEPEPRPR